jgi:RNA polymerase sigma factor (sigma-70 family)
MGGSELAPYHNEGRINMQDNAALDAECRQLYAQFCKRDRRGALKFVDTYGNRLLRYISNTLIYNTSEDRDDCLQRVWIKIIQHCGKDVPNGGCVAFILVIAKHDAIDWIRAHSAAGRKPEGGIESYDAESHQAVDEEADPAKWLEALEATLKDEEQLRQFYAAVAELPEKQRQAVWLYLSDYSRKEMAACMGDGEETVKTYLRLAKDKLKKKLLP